MSAIYDNRAAYTAFLLRGDAAIWRIAFGPSKSLAGQRMKYIADRAKSSMLSLARDLTSKQSDSNRGLTVQELSMNRLCVRPACAQRTLQRVLAIHRS